MLKILIVEDDPQLAAAMSYLIEENVTYQVVGTPDDLASALSAAESHSPHLALVDLNLARGSDGFSVALRLGEMGVACLFVTAYPPNFPLPELAVGCLTKPFTGDDLHFALSWAEDRLRGRERFRSKLPQNFVFYEDNVSFPLEHELAVSPPLRLSAKLRIELRIARKVQEILERKRHD